MSNKRDRQEAWEAQDQIIVPIVKSGIQKYVETLPDLYKAFALQDRTVRCTDERTPGGIHIAGSGILLGERVFDLLQNADVTGITSHHDCNDVRFYAQEKGFNTERADEYGKAWAEELALKLNVPYQGHIKSEQLVGSPNFHHARITYYDGTGRFDPSRISGLPSGFVINRRYVHSDDAKKEMSMAASVVLGEQGSGDLFTKHTPFLVVVIGDENTADYSLGALKQELQGFEENYNSRVRVDGFMISF